MTETLVYTPKSNRAPGGSSEYANTNFFLPGCSSGCHVSIRRGDRTDPVNPAGLARTACRTPTVRYVRTRISDGATIGSGMPVCRRHGTRTVATNAAVDEQV
jgi:hypothetical protein